MSTKDHPLYGIRRASKPAPTTADTSFSNSLSSLIASSASTKTNPRDRPKLKPAGPKRKDDIFTTHNRNTKKRAAADMLATTAQHHSTSSEALDDAAWKRTKRRMDEKARLYAALKRGDVEDEAERYGVDFDRKWAERGEGAEDSEQDESGESEDEDEAEVVEYVDEFGRTRKGTKREVEREEMRRKRAARGEAEVDRFTARPAAPAEVIYGDTIQTSAFNPDEMTFAQMEELAKTRDREPTPPPAVHYDANSEVRTRGTGFYHFSREEEERQKEMAALGKEREETERARGDLEKSREAEARKRKEAVEERRRIIREKKGKVQADRFLASMRDEMAKGARGG